MTTENSNDSTNDPTNAASAHTAHSDGVMDRRLGLDRRRGEVADPTNLERRRGPGRRLSDFVRDAEDGEMNKEQFMFLMAIDAFKRVNGKNFPAWTDVLEVVRKLGYFRGRAQTWLSQDDAERAQSRWSCRRLARTR
ncbi:MAG: hypothetical protein DWI10_02525 [Planctomycetota bacterium]|nr:MAG: hypothetical protein DWI10_02525 [Planctomycetota bacterium]